MANQTAADETFEAPLRTDGHNVLPSLVPVIRLSEADGLRL